MRLDEFDNNEFEFPCMFHETETCTITADDIFFNGKIRPIFATPKHHLTTTNVSKPPVKTLMSQSLRCLFKEEKESDHSCSSSETDELDGVLRDTYCEWTPKKSNSMRTSKRWKFPTLLRRCNSDNRDVLVFYDHREEKRAGKVNTTVLGHYASKRAEEDGNRRKSYLPYKPDVIGLFSNINRSNKAGSRK